MSHLVQRITFANVICLSPTLIQSANAGFFDKSKGVLDTLQKDTQVSKPDEYLSDQAIHISRQKTQPLSIIHFKKSALGT